MKLFTLKDKKVKGISTVPFKLEKEIQVIVENNLKEIFELQFVKSEFSIRNFRFDTLGYDEENRRFVVIEYKKDRNFSVIDQGYTYLLLMLDNKSDFILVYNENCGKNLKKDDVDWSQSRVIFISQQFTEFQKHSGNFKDVPFELWEINRYDNGLIGFTQHKTSSDESVSTISTIGNTMVEKVSREVKVYTEEYHFTKNVHRREFVIELYNSIKDRITSLGEVEIVPRKEYIGFRRRKPFVDIIFYTDHLKLVINLKKGELDDPKNMTRDISGSGQWGNCDYEVKEVDQDTDLDYLMFLIKQSYKKQD
jgi:predicted transport protein